MNQSKLNNLFSTIDDAVSDLYETHKTEYDLARYHIRSEKLDHMLKDVISDDERNQLNELEENCRTKHKKYCNAIKNVRDLVEQAINAMGSKDIKDINNERLTELEGILNELPECPSESDFLNISDMDSDSLSTNNDDDDEIVITSDSFDDEDVNEEPIDDKNINNSSLLRSVIEKAEVMKKFEAELKELEELKNQSKMEMFMRREQNLDIVKHQQYQRELFNKINELKIKYRRAKADVKGMIEDILVYLNDDTIGEELRNLLYRIETEDAIEQSQAVSMQQGSRITQISSRTIKSTTQAPSMIPQIQFASKIPQVSSRRPQTPSKIPQIASRLAPQLPRLPNQLSVPSRIPHISKVQQSRPATQQTRIPQVPKSQIPSQMMTSNIPRQSQRLAPASNIPQIGYSQMMRNQPGVMDRRRELSANLKISESIGNMRKVRARPAVGGIRKPQITGAQVTQLDRVQSNNLSPAQRKNINKQNEIKTQDAASRILDELDKRTERLASKMSVNQREAQETEDLERLIESMLRIFFKELDKEELSYEIKIKVLEEKLKKFLGEVGRIMRQYRGKFFKPDEAANEKFIQKILKHFNETKNFENFREILGNFFKRLPSQKFQIPKASLVVPIKKTSTPIPQRRPSSARQIGNVARALPKRPSTVGAKKIQSKVQAQIKSLKNVNPQKLSAQAAIKQKLYKFVDGFCKIFILNQKNRRNKFDIWVKTFRDNIRPILNDLDAFYKTLPFPELQKFNRQQVEQSLDRLLHQVYEQTRKYELTNIKCKDLIGNEMKKLMEQKQLKNLNESLSVFLQGIKELIEPYVEAPKIQQQQQQSPSIMQKSANKKPTMLQRLHESNIQRALHRTLMNETDESIEYPSFNESVLQQIPITELQAMYRKMLKGKYQIPNVQSTAAQAMMLEKIENLLRRKVQRGMARKRDESFLRSHGRRNQSISFPIHERIAPSSINIFKRVMGANEILESIETTDEMLKALDIVLESCENVDENICKVLINQNRNEMSALDESLSALVAHIKNLVYNNNIIDYEDEIVRLDKLHMKVDVDELKSKLGRKVFTKAECENFLQNAFTIQVNENDDAAVYAVVEFIKDLRYLEYKYMLKILKGEIRGDTERILTNIEPSREDISTETPSLAYIERIKTVQPIRVIKNYDYPRDLIERDILYVACQLTNRLKHSDDDDSDTSEHLDYLSRFIIQIAQKFQNNAINERNALRIIGQIFYMLPCIPISFYQQFIYHADNEYFSAIRFNNPSLNTAARIEMIAMKNRSLCAEDKLLYGRQVTLITNQIEHFMFLFDNEIEEIARSFNALDIRDRRRMKIAGNEISKNASGVLGNPMTIDTKEILDGKIDNVQITLVTNQAPVSNLANEKILQNLDEIDAILDKHLNETDHFENSKIAKLALKNELQPNAIKRKNYWQCRGSEIPKWFPGFYTVFPNTISTKPLPCSIEQILPHAWRMMAPINYK